MKYEQEMNALGELVSGVREDQDGLKKRVDALADRFTLLDLRVGDLDTTVTGMKPMLERNTDLTDKAAKGSVENKKVLDRIEPSIADILKIVTERQQRDAARAFVARWGRFCKSTAATVSATLALAGVVGAAIVGAIKWFSLR